MRRRPNGEASSSTSSCFAFSIPTGIVSNGDTATDEEEAAQEEEEEEEERREPAL